MPDIMVYVLLLALALAYSWFAGAARSFTTAALVAVAVPVAALALAAPRVQRADPARAAPIGRAALLWLVPLLAFGLLEALSLLVWHSSYEHPSVSVLLDRPLDSHPVRSLAVFGWLATGWWVIRR